MEPDLEKTMTETNSKEWTGVEVARSPLISCHLGMPAALPLCKLEGSPPQRGHHWVWGTDSWSSAAKERGLTLPANSRIIVAMQRIHHHIGR